METQGQKVLSLITQRVIPDPWQNFEMKLLKDGAISTNIVQGVFMVCKRGTPETQKRALLLFDEKLENLAEAQNLLRNLMQEYDSTGTWEKLDATMQTIDIESLLVALRKDFGLHPFPDVLKSLKFNWNFMRKDGVRAFYVMTDEYLTKIENITKSAKQSFQKETETNLVEPYWLFHMDLASIEVPAHCDVCRMTITAVILLTQEQNIQQHDFVTVSSLYRAKLFSQEGIVTCLDDLRKVRRIKALRTFCLRNL